MSSVRVAVRVRPLNKREKQLSSKVVIHMKGNTTSIHKLKDSVKSFSFDFSYDSSDRGRPAFASQKRVSVFFGLSSTLQDSGFGLSARVLGSCIDF
uniref:Kinesin motor domain-containing protein n=1 Tax=Amphiprion percula TaxID=161767 RepID=A0A3P8U6Q0_AMPPE